MQNELVNKHIFQSNVKTLSRKEEKEKKIIIYKVTM